MTMLTNTASELHIPDGINYECTGCGKCCGGWSVPLTEADYKRIAAVNWAQMSSKYNEISLFRELKGYEKKGTPYTHAIKEGKDGHCPFLVDNLCFIHSQFDIQYKPSICQLFPYCFSETPSGIYVTVSFISMGVIHNSGNALADQRSFLEQKLSEFRKLFPDHHPNWSKLQLTVGKPISWEDYLAIEKKLLEHMQERRLPVEQRFIKGSVFLISLLKRNLALNSGSQLDLPQNENAALKPLDVHLLIALHKVYFPAKPLGRSEANFSVLRFLFQICFQKLLGGLRVTVPGKSFSLEQLQRMNWPENDIEIEDLIYRYFFSRIFAKLYFGAGFAQLSLIVGFHHLAILYALLKLQSKALAMARGFSQISYVDVIASVRQLEKRLGEATLNGYAAAMFEMLIYSPGRIKRILANV